MADPAFFKKAGTFTLAEIARLTGAELLDAASGSYKIEDVAALDKAGSLDLTFLDNAKYKTAFTSTKAGACFVKADMTSFSPKGVRLLVTQNPYKSFALAAQAFYPMSKPPAAVSPHARIAAGVQIGEGCTIEDGVVIKSGAVIGKDCWLEANCVIGENVQIGARTRIGALASVSHAHIGQHVYIYTGARIGQDGFGFAIDPKGHVKVPQLGRVMIGDHVEIGANTTVDRGAGPDTIIGDGAWIDNLVQIAHNVVIGRGCVIAGQVGISGSTVLQDFVALGGQAGVAGHLSIGAGARIAAQSGIMKNIPARTEYMGYPARPRNEFLRQMAALNRLIKKEKSG